MAARRLFVALEPPEAVRRRLAQLQAALRRAAGPAAGRIRWVEADRLHLTLQFLGAVPEERVPAVEAALAAAAAGARPLSLEVKGAGGFPNGRRPRVLWAGLEGDVPALAALAGDLGRRLAALGFPPEDRPFSAHLTLGRAREPRGEPGLGGALAEVGQQEGVPWRAVDLVLFESHLSPRGPRYEAVARVRLGAPAP